MYRLAAIALAMLIAPGAAAGRADIHEAVRAGNVAAVAALLDETPALIAARDTSGATPLHAAARGTVPAMLALLVARGADLDAVDQGGEAALHILASRGDVSGLALLLDRGARIDIAAGDGGTPLHAAAMSRQVEALRLLAGRKADLEHRNRYGRTPLVLAAREMRGTAVIGALLDLGARIDAADSAGDTALTLAAWRGSRDVVDLLLARGAAIPVSGPTGRQLLERAVSTGLPGLFARMIERGAEVPPQPAEGGTLLHLAAEGGSLPIVQALVDRRFDIRRQDANGWTPLHFAVDMGRTDAAVYLLDKGADLNARTVMGQTARNIAGDNGDAAMTALVDARGADPAPPRFPEWRGPYLGQARPGETAVRFAPGIVSGRYSIHANVVFSPDGTEAYWSVSVPPRGSGYGSGRTLISRLVDGRWTCPARAVFDGIPVDDAPVFSPDGQHLYDMSFRPLPGGEEAGREHIWVRDRTPGGWTRPRPLDPAVNRLPQHWQFSVDRAGTVYFSSTWGGERGIFAARVIDGRYTEPEYLSALGEAGMPFVAPDGSYLLTVQGRNDVQVSFRAAQGAWGPPMSLGAAAAGVLPTVSPDGRYLFVRRGDGIYWMDAAVIERLRPTPPAAAAAGQGKTDMTETVLRIEDSAMEAWRQGNPMRWADVSGDDVLYMDPGLTAPVEGRAAYVSYLEPLKGKIFYDASEYVQPRAAVYGDIAVLTYNYHSLRRDKAGKPERTSFWNTTEVYRLTGGTWRIAHTHWSYIGHRLPESPATLAPAAATPAVPAGAAAEIMRLETDALARWRQGDAAHLGTVAADGITSFEPDTPGRLNGLGEVQADAVQRAARTRYDTVRIVEPRFRVGSEAVVLFYQLEATARGADGSVTARHPWNCTRVYARKDARWVLVHSHRSFVGGVRPDGGV